MDYNSLGKIFDTDFMYVNIISNRLLALNPTVPRFKIILLCDHYEPNYTYPTIIVAIHNFEKMTYIPSCNKYLM